MLHDDAITRPGRVGSETWPVPTAYELERRRSARLGCIVIPILAIATWGLVILLTYAVLRLFGL